MNDKIINTTEEHNNMSVNLKDCTKKTVKAKTVYTHWESGRKDCTIQILDPLNSVSKNNKEK